MISIASYPRHRGTNHLKQLLDEFAPRCPKGHVMESRPFAKCTIWPGDRPLKERMFLSRANHWECRECHHLGPMAPFDVNLIEERAQ